MQKCIKSIIEIARNIFRYGFRPQRINQRIWVDPKKIKYFLPPSTRGKYFCFFYLIGGDVLVGGDWDRNLPLFNEMEVFKACYDHWVSNVSWEDTGFLDVKMQIILKEGQVENCRNYEELYSRYLNLDEVFTEIKRNGRFFTREELSGKKRHFFKGRGEIKIFIDRNGDPILGGNGSHRLSIAKILELPEIPARIAGMHPDGREFYNHYVARGDKK